MGNQNEYRSIKLIISFVAMLFLASCGGGGGGGGTTPTANPTPATPVDTSEDFSNKTDEELRSLASEVYTASELVSLTSMFNGLGAAFQPVTENCTADADGGTLDILIPPGTTGTGTLTFANCDLGGIVVNGSIVLKSPSSLANFSSDLAFNNLNMAVSEESLSITINGTTYYFTSSNGLSGRISTNGGSITYGITSPDLTGSITVNDFDMTYSKNSSTGVLSTEFNYSLSSTGIGAGGDIAVTTTSPILHRDDIDSYPFAGSFEITGKNGATIRVTISGDGTSTGGNVTVEIDKDGTAGFETTTVMTWDEF